MNWFKELFCHHRFVVKVTGKEAEYLPFSYEWYRRIQYKYTEHLECTKCGKKDKRVYYLQR